MWPVSAAFLEALSSPQRVTVRADVDKGGSRLFSGLPVLAGQVEVDSSAVTRRRVSLTLAPRLRTGDYTDAPTLPVSPGDPLGHYGQEISLYWGLTYIGGLTEWVPLGVFRIDDVAGSLLGDSPVAVRGVSREAHVADARFESATTRSSPSAVALIATLIHEVLPSAEVVVSATRNRRVPATTWDEDRWGAITDLAESIGAVVHTDPVGRFVVADAPGVGTGPAWRVSAGPGGVLVGAAAESSRSRVYNAVVVRGGSPSSDSPPVQAVARDGGVSSPTRWGDPDAGAWGRRPRFMQIPSIRTVGQARDTARANLARYVGAAATLDVTAVPNPALDAGDVVEVIPDPSDPAGSVRRHFIDSMTVPLAPGGTFRMSTRDVADVEVEDA